MHFPVVLPGHIFKFFNPWRGLKKTQKFERRQLEKKSVVRYKHLDLFKMKMKASNVCAKTAANNFDINFTCPHPQPKCSFLNNYPVSYWPKLLHRVSQYTTSIKNAIFIALLSPFFAYTLPTSQPSLEKHLASTLRIQ